MKGHALTGRRLTLPKDWIEDAECRKAANIPEAVTFAAKPETGIAQALIAAMAAAAPGASVPRAWVLGGKVHGRGKSLRVMLERHAKPYVLSIRGNERLMMGGFRPHTAADPAAGLSSDDWPRLAAAEGSKGPRLYDWAKPAKGSIARSSIAEVWPAEGELRLFRLQAPPWDHWLLIRRSIAAPAGIAFHVTFGPHTTDLNERAAACLHWTIAECFQSAKRETGLDRCEARSWHGGHR